jgi:hypothetical protein
VVIVHPDPDEKHQTMFDIGEQATFMGLAAWELRIGSYLASIYEPNKAQVLLGFPQALILRIVISVGHLQDKNVLLNQPKTVGRYLLYEIV